MLGGTGASERLSIPLREADALLARKLIGVVAIQKGVFEYTMAEQVLSATFTRKMVNAMKGASDPPPGPPPRPPPSRPSHSSSSRRWTRLPEEHRHGLLLSEL